MERVHPTPSIIPAMIRHERHEAAQVLWSESNELGAKLYERSLVIIKAYGLLHAYSADKPNDIRRAISINAFTPMCHFLGEEGGDRFGAYFHIQVEPRPDQQSLTETFVNGRPIMLWIVRQPEQEKSIHVAGLTLNRSGRITYSTLTLSRNRLREFMKLANSIEEQLSGLTVEEQEERAREVLRMDICIPIDDIIYQKPEPPSEWHYDLWKDFPGRGIFRLHPRIFEKNPQL